MISTPPVSTRRSVYVSAALALLITISFVRYPEAAFKASLDGMKLWFDVVLPALLPFFAMAEILMGLGVIHGIGVLLEPLMRPVFRIPGVGGFAVAMGLASGYPLGAKIAGRIRREGLCTREEGERLLSFANTADPLFMVGAVAVGMFALPQVGLPIAVAHYAGAFLVGYLMRFHEGGKMGLTVEKSSGPIFSRALTEMVEARRRDGRPIGEIFGDAVKESMQSMLFIGGCIMMFSVFLKVVELSGMTALIAAPMEALLPLIGLAPALADAVLQGAFEITIGTQAAGAATVDLLQRCVVASAIIGWSGLSVHAQVAAMVYGTDIRIGPYLLARLAHGVAAAIFTAILFKPLGGLAAAVETSVGALTPAIAPAPAALFWGVTLVALAVVLVGLLVLSFFLYIGRKARFVYFKVR